MINDWIENMRKLSTDFSYIPTDKETQKARELIQMIHYVPYVEIKEQHREEFTKRVLEYMNVESEQLGVVTKTGFLTK